MRALRFRPEDRATGARIGGTVPLGQEYAIMDSGVQYFGTFPITELPHLEFSVFHRFEIFAEHDTRDVILHNNKILAPSDLIWVTVHGPSERGSDVARPFEARGLDFGPEIADVTIDDDGNVKPYTESKLGGRCFLLRYWLQDEVSQLESAEYKQLLQIGMHGRDLIDGFPWDPGYLHVWAEAPENSQTYRFMVEH